MATRTIEKPWGHELVWAHTDRYVGKILHIRAGEALSLQYHRTKDETIMVLNGRMRLRYSESPGNVHASPEIADAILNHEKHFQELTMSPGDAMRILPGMRHQMIAIDNTDVLEVSTPELDDVVRLADRYGRAGR